MRETEEAIVREMDQEKNDVFLTLHSYYVVYFHVSIKCSIWNVHSAIQKIGVNKIFLCF